MTLRAVLLTGTLGLIVAMPAMAQSAGRFAVRRTTATASIEMPAAIASSQDLMFVVSMSATSGLSSALLSGSPTAGGGTSAMRSSSTMLQQASSSLRRAVPAPARASFVVVGDAGQSISVAVPTEVDLTRPGGEQVARLTTDSSLQDGPQFLGGDFADTGALSFDVGGQVTIASNEVSAGTYSGVLAVVAQYN